MKNILKHTILALAIVPIVAHAKAPIMHSTGHCFVISSEHEEDIPMPEYLKKLKSGKQVNAKYAPVQLQAIAYPATGPGNYILVVEGLVSAFFYNDTPQNVYFKINEFICVNEVKCSRFTETVGLLPGDKTVRSPEMFVNFQGTPGQYLNETFITASQLYTGNLQEAPYADDTAIVTIT